MALRDLSAFAIGPFRLRNGTFVFQIQGCIVTADEVLELKQKGQLISPDTIASFVANSIRNRHDGLKMDSDKEKRV
jgi:hypothetical protein